MEPPRPALLQRCRDAQRRLDAAIQCYLQRVADLEAATSNPIQYSPDRDLLEVAIQEAHQDSRLLPSRADQLMKARVTLDRIRNRSISLAPINRLPIEVLLQIFRFTLWQGPCTLCDATLSDPHLHIHRYPKPPFYLAHVCHHWRTVIASVPSIWSHVGISLSDGKDIINEVDYTRTCLQRVPNSPLCVWIDGSNSFIDKMEALKTCLTPYLCDLESFGLINHPGYSETLGLISFWLTHGKAGSVRHLTVWLDDFQKDWNLSSVNNAQGSQHLDPFLEPIRVLRLNGAYFDWDSSVYHNLVVLQLGGLGLWSSPTAKQLLAILSASPQLHTLKLYNMWIKPEAHESTPLPSVILRELKYFDVQCVHRETICELLSQVAPQSSRLSVRIDLYSASSELASAVQAFLSRSNVTKLYISNFGGANRLAEYLSTVPNLDTLILDLPPGSGPNDDHILAALMQSSKPNSKRAPLCPGLHTLTILGGSFGLTIRKEVVESHPALTDLRVIPDSDDPVLPGLYPEAPSELDESLVRWYL